MKRVLAVGSAIPLLPDCRGIITPLDCRFTFVNFVDVNFSNILGPIGL